MNLKYLLFFYFMILTPVLLLILFAKTGDINSQSFTIGILVYAVINRRVISGKRLLMLKKIERKDFYKVFIPFWTYRFGKDLYSW